MAAEAVVQANRWQRYPQPRGGGDWTTRQSINRDDIIAARLITPGSSTEITVLQTSQHNCLFQYNYLPLHVVSLYNIEGNQF